MNIRIGLLLAVFMAFSAGCSSLSQQDSRTAFLAEIAIKSATSRMINEADDPAGRAKRVIKIARTAKSLAEFGAVVLVEDLEQEINHKIDWQSLNSSEKILAEALVSAVKAELSLKISDGVIPERSIVLLQLTLDHIIEAAAGFVTAEIGRAENSA